MVYPLMFREGKMADLIKAYPWETTSLGPIETWPGVLHTSLDIVLGTDFPASLCWGSDLLMFYNDNYVELLGPRHPTALGKPQYEVWAEVWESLTKPIITRIFETGMPTWVPNAMLVTNRHGYDEESYYTFSMSAIRDNDDYTRDNNGSSSSCPVNGVFNISYENTGSVVSTRRFGTLQDFMRRNALAHSVQDVCDAAIATCQSNPQDIPFALLYLYEDQPDGTRVLKMKSSTGVPMGHLAAPSYIHMKDDVIVDQEGMWPFSQAIWSRKPVILNGVPERFGTFSGGAWPEPPQEAIVMPVAASEQENILGVWVVGVNSRMRFTESFLGFVEIFTRQIAGALNTIFSVEQERHRASVLAELDRAKTTFFNNVSHELRTPLTLITGPIAECISMVDNASSMTSSSSSSSSNIYLPEGLKHNLTIINRNADRLVKLVNNLLDFSRIEANKMKVHFQPTNLGQLTNYIVSMFEGTFRKARLDVVVDLPADPIYAYVDRNMWDKIVSNLLSNAFKFTLHGSIKIQLSEDGDFIFMSVSDTGVGIPPQEIPHLFERFHRVEGSPGRSYEGTGIGLALTQELVHLHGGEVTVTSSILMAGGGGGIGGSTFTVSIPSSSTYNMKEHIPPDQWERLQSLGPIDQAANRLYETDAARDSLGIMRSHLYVQEADHWLLEISRQSEITDYILNSSGNNNDMVLDSYSSGGGGSALNTKSSSATTTSFSSPSPSTFPTEPSSPSTIFPDTDSLILTSHNSSTSTSNKSFILLVDDNTDMCDYMSSSLRQRLDWHVHIVKDGKAALDYTLANFNNIHLIISDVMMPIMDGFDLIHALKSNRSTCLIPVILVSGRASEEGKIEGLKAGADDYLVKPFGMKELMARAQTHIELGRLRTSLEQKVRKRTEELMKANEELHISETRYRVLSTFSPSGILHTDARGELLYVNDQCLQLMGVSRDQAAGHGWRSKAALDDTQLIDWFMEGNMNNNNVDGNATSTGPSSSSSRLSGDNYRFNNEVHFEIPTIREDGQSTTTSVWALVQSQPIIMGHHHHDQGHVIGHVFVMTDISELKRLQRSNLDAVQRAEAAQYKRAQDAEMHRRQQESFVDMICHEIRNPLNGILNNADLLSTSLQQRRNNILATSTSNGENIYNTNYGDNNADDDIENNNHNNNTELILHQISEDEEAVDAIMVCAKHQLLITNDVLQLSKLESGNVLLNNVHFNPVTMIQSVTRMFEAEARVKDINFSVSFSPFNLPSSSGFNNNSNSNNNNNNGDGDGDDMNNIIIEADPHRISQVLINLLSNAFRFTAGCPVRQIEVCVGLYFHNNINDDDENDDNNNNNNSNIFMHVNVRDSGIGMSSEQQTRLFQRFKQVNMTVLPHHPHHHNQNASSDYAGSGLGLHLSKSFVKLLGGELFVESSLNEGSMFSFSVKARLIGTRPPPSIPSKTPTVSSASSPQSFTSFIRSSLLPSPSSTISSSSPSSSSSASSLFIGGAAGSKRRRSTLENRTILIVEDNRLNQRVLQRHITQAGYDCIIASNGLEAVNIVQQYYNNKINNNTNVPSSSSSSSSSSSLSSTLHLVFMDLEMPVMGGIEATRRIRDLEGAHVDAINSLNSSSLLDDAIALSSSSVQMITSPPPSLHSYHPAPPRLLTHLPSLPIIGLSGNARESHIKEALAAGMQEFITKPYQKDNLFQTIEKWLIRE